jgi:hypothetical protein
MEKRDHVDKRWEPRRRIVGLDCRPGSQSGGVTVNTDLAYQAKEKAVGL